MIRPGPLRHRIKIMFDAGTDRDDAGAIIPDPQVFAEIWASVEPLQGRELFNVQQVQADVTTRTRLRYLAGVTPKHWIVHESRRFDIMNVIDRDDRHIELELLCKESV